MTPDAFKDLMTPIAAALDGKPIDAAMETYLNETFPANGAAFGDIASACHAAIKAGWMCEHGTEGRRWGRVIEPAPDSYNFSVDVVALRDFVGPHHSHPTGEVCMVMPVDDTAEFDGHGAGWCINEPGTAHRPTVRNGEALVLYLLPNGEINFTGK